MNCNGQRGNQRQGGLNSTPRCRVFGDFSKHKLDKNLLVGRARRSILEDSVKDVRNIRSEVKLYICKFCVVLLHKGSFLERYHSLRNYWNLYVQFLQYWVQEFHLYCQIITKNPLRRFTFKVRKMSRNCGYLMKGPPRRQCVSTETNLYLHASGEVTVCIMLLSYKTIIKTVHTTEL
jgi:hypothetical protein